jgi:hypothetical protein
MTRHLADAARNVSGWYVATIHNNGAGVAGVLLQDGLIGFRVGESDTEPSGYYITAAGRAAVAQES